MMRRIKVGSVAVATVVGSSDRQRFTDRWKSDTLVLYDGGGRDDGSSDSSSSSSSEETHPSPKHCQLQQSMTTTMMMTTTTTTTTMMNEVVSLLLGRLRTDGCRVFYLQGGFTDFQKKYGDLCVGDDRKVMVKDKAVDEEHVLSFGLGNLRLAEITQEETIRKEGRSTPDSAFPFPVQVIPFLFLGNAENSKDLNCLNRHGIRYILNVTADIPNTFETDKSFKYLQIPITDNLSQNLTAFFPNAIAFIDEARNKACGVLVHCLAGISRSVTVTVAYLMFTKSMSMNDAYEYLRQCKPNISPNFNFMGQLLDFESVLQSRLQCSCRSTFPNGDPVDAVLTPSCDTCRNTKTYFSSPTLPNDQ